MKITIKTIITGALITLLILGITIFIIYKNYEYKNNPDFIPTINENNNNDAKTETSANDEIQNTINNESDNIKNDENKTNKVKLYLFHGSTCPACLNAKEKMKKDLLNIDNLEIVTYEVWENEDNALLMDKVAEKLNIEVNYIPFLVINSYNKVGYNKEDILNEINNPSQDIIKEVLDENPDLKPISDTLK
ncbi:MAG: hypothetical protein E7163_00775 [Firmicutes bacterium]|nr:hypothetical protein [Bacillota bacterium]